jgi:hypothetical protein
MVLKKILFAGIGIGIVSFATFSETHCSSPNGGIAISPKLPLIKLEEISKTHKECINQKVLEYKPCSQVVYTYTLLSGCFGGKCTCVNTDPKRRYACGKRVVGVKKIPSGNPVILKWDTCCVCDDDTGRLEMHIKVSTSQGKVVEFNYDKTCPGDGKKVLTTSSGNLLSYDVAYYDTWGGDGAVIEVIIPTKNYRCPINGKIYKNAKECNAECYIETTKCIPY